MKCDREHCGRFKHSHINIFFLCDKPDILSRLTCYFKAERECIYLKETTLESKDDKQRKIHPRLTHRLRFIIRATNKHAAFSSKYSNRIFRAKIVNQQTMMWWSVTFKRLARNEVRRWNHKMDFETACASIIPYVEFLINYKKIGKLCQKNWHAVTHAPPVTLLL